MRNINNYFIHNYVLWCLILKWLIVVFSIQICFCLLQSPSSSIYVCLFDWFNTNFVEYFFTIKRGRCRWPFLVNSMWKVETNNYWINILCLHKIIYDSHSHAQPHLRCKENRKSITLWRDNGQRAQTNNKQT